jgi:hypothetical protein
VIDEFFPTGTSSTSLRLKYVPLFSYSGVFNPSIDARNDIHCFTGKSDFQIFLVVLVGTVSVRGPFRQKGLTPAYREGRR